MRQPLSEIFNKNDDIFYCQISMHPTRQLVESAAHTTPRSKSVLMDFETVTKVVIQFQVELNALAKCTHAHNAEESERGI